ncbi:MAG: dTDP-4-dehydrorhamnose 3,5-epimerase family protein [Chloroflexia bacterium]|nr:dTDP-4-dehydrorhamnose 3,5-epimerase family protein [Chloroflexia bacterium]
MILGVETKQLLKHADDRGFLMEILRSDDAIMETFGQVYVSMNHPGVVRAWHWHEHQEDLFCCIQGMIQVPLYDMREDSPTYAELNEFFLGEHHPIVLRIPRGVAHGYKTIGVIPSLLLNFPSRPYNREQPDELRLAWNTEKIPYSWETRFR